MKKAMLDVFICFSLLLMMLPVAAEKAEGEKIAPVTGFGSEKLLSEYEPVFLMDFENYGYAADSNHGFDETTGTSCFPGSGEAEYGMYFSMTTTTSFRAFKNAEKPLTEGTYLMSFDFHRTEREGTFYIRPVLSTGSGMTTGNIYETFACSGGNIGYYSASHGWTMAKPMAYEAGKWYHVMMWMNFDNGQIDYYINNEYRGQTSMPKSAYGFWLMNESKSSTNVTSIDNFAVYKVSPKVTNTLAAAGINVPLNETYVLKSQINSQHLGNLFTDFKDLEMSVVHRSSAAEEMVYDVLYLAKDYRGDIAWQEEKKDLRMEPGGTFTDTVFPKVERYDIYTFYCILKPHDERYAASSTDAQFSIVNAPSEDFASERFGACMHISKGATKWDQIKYAVDTLGIGYIRDDFGWSRYEPEKGKYGFTGSWADTMNHFVDEAAEMGVKIIGIWYATNPLYGEFQKIPRTREQLEAMEEACAHFAAEYKGKIDIVEFTNEPNFARQDAMSCKEYAVALQYFYRGIKRGNPDAIVLAGGLSRAAADWIAKVMAEGGKGYCDAVSIHPYQEAGTPESKKWDVYCGEVRTALAEVGCGDLPVWTTEGNTSSANSYNTEQQQGMNLVRQLAQCDAYNVQDKFIWYQMQTVDTDINDNEACFGILRGPAVKNAYGAKAAYIAAANYMSQTENAEFVDDIQYDNVWNLRFKKTDGSYMVMMYADREVKTVSLNLGAASGTLCDINGNAKTVASEDGKYTFIVSDEPIYFSYSGESFERCEDAYAISESVHELPQGCTGIYEFEAPVDAVITVSAPENLNTEIVREGDKSVLRVTVKEVPESTAYSERRHNFGTILHRDKIEVNIKQGANEIYLPFAIEYLNYSADITATMHPYDNTSLKYWKGKVCITNNRIEENLNGSIVIDAPKQLADSVSPIVVENLAPGKEGKYTFNIPKELTKGNNQLFAGRLVLQDGEEIPFSIGGNTRSYGYRENTGVSLKYLKKAHKTPTIDGVIDEDEWKNYRITDFDKSQVSYGSTNTVIAGVAEQATFGAEADYGGKADFSGSIFAQWDERFLYLAAIVYDDVHYQKEDPLRFYLDDFFYINVCPTKMQRHDTRLELALTSFFGDNKGRLYRNWSEMFDISVGGVIPDSEEGAWTEAVRKDNVTIYECRIPWEEVVSEETLKNKNFNLTFGIRDYDGDRDKTFTYGGWYCLVDPKE